MPVGFFATKNQKKAAEKGVFFSLTTTPGRIKKLKATIASLLDQEVAAAGIILNIPEKYRRSGQTYSIPPFISNIPQVDINRCVDFGPATKLLPTLKKLANHSHAKIIVVDDDQVYPKGLVKTYIQAAENSPKTALGLCGWNVPGNFRHPSREVKRGAGIRIFDAQPNIHRDETVDILQGATSYMVRVNFFDKRVFDLIESAYSADDIWISGHLAKNGISKKVLKTNFAYARIDAYHTREHLKHSVNKSNEHNNYLYEYFSPYWSK